MFLFVIIKLLSTIAGFNFLLQGKFVEGMLFILSAQVMDVDMKVSILSDKLLPKKKKDDQSN